MKPLKFLFDHEKLSSAAGYILAGAFLAAGVALSVYDDRLYREQALREVRLQTEILAASEAASLDFDDRKATQEYLDALKVNPEVVQAAVYNSAGALVAQYIRSGEQPVPVSPPPDSYAHDSDFLTAVVPVEHNARRIGTVYLRAMTEPLARRLPRYGAGLLLLSMAAFVVGVLGTARARLSAANAKLLAEMEERGKVEEALRQSQKMEAVGQLTGGIAHDFNNMLAIVMGSLSILKRRIAAGGAELEMYADRAMEGARRAANLTQQLLAFSRRQPLAPVPLNVTTLIFEMSELMGRTLGELTNLEIINSPGTWHVYADRVQLETAILNLAVNARDAMPGGGKLVIKSTNARLTDAELKGPDAPPPGDYVAISVADTGQGMSPEILAKAFEPFFTTKAVGKGTGLGLSQVYGFAKQSRGHLEIQSAVGQGTTVTIFLPRQAQTEAVIAADATAPKVVPQGKPEEVVLVVEDQDNVRRMTVDTLRELGYSVRHCEGVRTALRYLEDHPDVSLLFTDIVMPDGSGKVLADEVQRKYPHIKVLFTTGYTKDAIVHDGMLDPHIQVVMKPFTFEQLAEKVREILEQPSREPHRPEIRRLH
ncbi:MAG: ATP-binding protein [Rhodospirillaceae bacterium]